MNFQADCQVFGAEVLLWQIGNAKCTFPDTAAGAVLDVILIESGMRLGLSRAWGCLKALGESA